MLGDVREEELPGFIAAEEHQEASGDDSGLRWRGQWAGNGASPAQPLSTSAQNGTNVVLDGVAAETEV